jgi:hypothetical protein
MSKKFTIMDLSVTITLTLAEWNEIIQSIQDDDVAIMLVNEFPKKIRDRMQEELKGTKPM